MITKTKVKMSDAKFWVTTPEKEKGREHFSDQFISPLNVCLIFPGSGCVDIKLFIKKGIINSNTLIIAIEKDRNSIKKIEKYLKTLPNEYYIHDRDLRYFSNLEEVLDGREIDGAFLDFCGQIDPHSTYWIMKNKHLFADGSIIGYTVGSNPRKGQKFIDKFDNYCLKGNPNKWMKTCLTRYYEESMSYISHIDNCYSFYNPTDIKRIPTRQRKDSYIFNVCKVFSIMFDSFCEISSVFTYKDEDHSHGMNLIIGKIDRQKEFNTDCHLSLYHFIKEYYSNSMSRRNKKHSVTKVNSKEKFQELKVHLIQNGVKNNGVIKVKPSKKAWVDRYSQMFGKKTNKVWDGIKAVVSRKTGKKATVYTIPNKS